MIMRYPHFKHKTLTLIHIFFFNTSSKQYQKQRSKATNDMARPHTECITIALPPRNKIPMPTYLHKPYKKCLTSRSTSLDIMTRTHDIGIEVAK